VDKFIVNYIEESLFGETPMKNILDLDRYPLDKEGSKAWQAMVAQAVSELEAQGMFNLEGFVRPDAVQKLVAQIKPVMDTRAYTHKRLHNIYFQPDIPGLEPNHPALRKVETINHTLCADQISDSLVLSIYQYPPFARFLAATMGKPELHVMQDPLASVNVMAYRAGEALNWHFDRSEFTTTLLLQAPEMGGEFEYRTDLRSANDPNYAGVAALIEGRDPQVQRIGLHAGTLNVFRGKNTAHRVTPVAGRVERFIAVFSYYEKPDVMFSDAERLGFYGRVG
jgi:hypothetical protein